MLFLLWLCFIRQFWPLSLSIALFFKSINLTYAESHHSKVHGYRTAADAHIRKNKLKRFTERQVLHAKACVLSVVNALTVEPSPLKGESDFSLFEGLARLITFSCFSFPLRNMYFSRPLTILLFNSSKVWSRRTNPENPFSVVSHGVKEASIYAFQKSSFVGPCRTPFLVNNAFHPFLH